MRLPLGVDQDAFAAVEAGESPGAPEAAVALDLARAILRGNLRTATPSMLRASLGDAGIFEVSTLVGYYSTLAVQLALFDVRP